MTTIENTIDTKTNGRAKRTGPIRSDSSNTQDGVHGEFLVEHVSIDRLVPSPTQPRKKFTGIDELAEDMKVRILSPLIVRPVGATFLEIVDGERRYRAAKKAGLTLLPVSIRTLSGAQVVEIQLVSQGQRQDLHPLEEADTYALLQTKYSYSVDDIALKTGKSTATIHNRLKLSTLCQAARAALLDDKITLAIALLVAKIADPAKQAEATKKALTEGDYRDGMSLSEVRDLVVREYTLVLKDASFDRADKSLVVAAGACSTCPKRTGANPSLFSDFETKDDLCTDAKCFNAKKEADWARKSADAKKKGLAVLSDAEAKKVFAPFTNGVVSGSSFVDLDAKNIDDKKRRTNAEIIGKKLGEVQIVIARDEDGNTHQLVKKKDFVAVAPVAAAPKPSAADKRDADANKAHRAKEKAKELAHDARLASVAELAAKREPTEEFWRVLAASLGDINHYRAREVCKRREIPVKDTNPASRELKKTIATMTGSEARGLCVELMCESSHYNAERLKAFEVAFGGTKKPRAKLKLKAKPVAKKKAKR